MVSLAGARALVKIRIAHATRNTRLLRSYLRTMVADAQQGWRTEDSDSPLLWFSGLKLVSLTIEGGDAVFVWRDPVDDTYHGWRWKICWDDLSLAWLDLREDIDTTDPTEPDQNGVCWWGVRQFTPDENGTDDDNCVLLDQFAREDIPDCPQCGVSGEDKVTPIFSTVVPAPDDRPQLKENSYHCASCGHEWLVQIQIRRDEFAEELRSIQETWRTCDAHTPELWFATLKLEDVTVSNTAATFVLCDPSDGIRYGWRWVYVSDDFGVIAKSNLGLMWWHLAEDLNQSEPTEPDENGIRWLGVHLFATDEDTPDCPKCGAHDVEPGATYTVPAKNGRPPMKDDWWRCTACRHEWMTVRFPMYTDQPDEETADS